MVVSVFVLVGFTGGVVVLVLMVLGVAGQDPHLAMLLDALEEEFQCIDGHFVHAEPVFLGDAEI